MNYIRYTIGICVLGILLAGCQQDTLDTVLPDGQGELVFNTSLEGEQTVQTRSYAGDIQLSTTGFYLTGYLTSGNFDSGTQDAPNVLNTSGTYQSVDKLTNNTNGKFTIPLPKISPDDPNAEDLHKISYFGWAQGEGGESGAGITDFIRPGYQGHPYVDVSLPYASKKQPDVVVAQVLNMRNDYVTTSVDLDFRHLFSKLSFYIHNSSGSTIKVTKAELIYAAGKVYSKARFTFNATDTLGAFSQYDAVLGGAAVTPESWTMPELTVGSSKQLMGNTLLLPQKLEDGSLSVKLTYNIQVTSAVSTSISRTIPLKALYAGKSKNYMYTFDIAGEEVRAINMIVGGWNEAPTGALPLVPGPCDGKTTLLLDGVTPPYEHEGKLYWLDQSGYNHHCEIVQNTAGAIVHDSDKKGYQFNTYATNTTITDYIKTPALGTWKNTTIETVMTCDQMGDYAYPFIFSNTTTISGTIPGGSTNNWLFRFRGGNQIDCYCANNTALPATQLSTMPAAKSGIAFYAFNCRDGKMNVMRNDSYFFSVQDVANGTTRANLLKDPTLNVQWGMIGAKWKGLIKYVKVINANTAPDVVQKDFKEFLTKGTYDGLESDYANAANKQYLPPVTSGLLLCLDGRMGNNTTNLWKDISLSGNNAVKKSNVGVDVGDVPTYSTSTYYYFGNGGRLILANSLGIHQEFTFEAVETVASGEGNWLVAFYEDNSNPEQNRELSIHNPYNGYFYFDSPQVSTYSNSSRLNIPVNDIQSSCSFDRGNRHQLCMTRAALSNAGIQAKVNGSSVPTNKMISGTSISTEAARSRALKEMKYCYIGGSSSGTFNNHRFGGYIAAIRFYNRVLTDEEKSLNLAADKAAFRF